MALIVDYLPSMSVDPLSTNGLRAIDFEILDFEIRALSRRLARF